MQRDRLHRRHLHERSIPIGRRRRRFNAHTASAATANGASNDFACCSSSIGGRRGVKSTRRGRSRHWRTDDSARKAAAPSSRTTDDSSTDGAASRQWPRCEAFHDRTVVISYCCTFHAGVMTPRAGTADAGMGGARAVVFFIVGFRWNSCVIIIRRRRL